MNSRTILALVLCLLPLVAASGCKKKVGAKAAAAWQCKPMNSAVSPGGKCRHGWVCQSKKYVIDCLRPMRSGPIRAPDESKPFTCTGAVDGESVGSFAATDVCTDDLQQDQVFVHANKTFGWRLPEKY